METNNTRYNGWTNYETWAVKLHIDNDEGSQRHALELAQQARDHAQTCRQVADGVWEVGRAAVYTLEDELRAEYEEARDNILGAGVLTGVFSDLLAAALSEVNFNEIAESLLEQLDEE